MSDRKRRIASTPEEQEAICVSLAMTRAQEQLEKGTASSQIIALFAKHGLESERLKNEQLRRENELLVARCEALRDAAARERGYAEAIKAFNMYRGESVEEEEDENIY